MTKIIKHLFFLLITQLAFSDSISIENLNIKWDNNRSNKIDETEIVTKEKRINFLHTNHWINSPIKYNIIQFSDKSAKIIITYLGNTISGKIITFAKENNYYNIVKVETFSTDKHSFGTICEERIIEQNNTLQIDNIFLPSKKCTKLLNQDKLMSLQNLVLIMQKYKFKNILSISDINLYLIQDILGNHNLVIYNNIAYHLQKAGANKEAIYLLEKIIEKFPDRTVAYYNLGDAYWELEEKEKAKKAYTTYIKQMHEKGLQRKIPKEILRRVKNK